MIKKIFINSYAIIVKDRYSDFSEDINVIYNDFLKAGLNLEYYIKEVWPNGKDTRNLYYIGHTTKTNKEIVLVCDKNKHNIIDQALGNNESHGYGYVFDRSSRKEMDEYIKKMSKYRMFEQVEIEI